MADRRRGRLLKRLLQTTYGYSQPHLEKEFGTHVNALLKELQLAGHVEPDGGDLLRLTVSGRNHARAALAKKAKAA
jgi:hypothetical protein